MHDEAALNHINMKLMAKSELTTGAFLKAANELLAETGSGANHLSQWSQSNCDPSDPALMNLIVVLKQRTKLLPMPPMTRLEVRERAREAREALNDGRYKQQVDDINDTHDLLEWIETYKELSANT